jgi:hypothetical protein
MELVLLISVAWWFVNFEPFQLLIDFIFKHIRITHLSNYIHASLGCWKCWSFWTILIMTYDFKLACLGALISYFILLCLNKLNLNK